MLVKSQATWYYFIKLNIPYPYPALPEYGETSIYPREPVVCLQPVSCAYSTLNTSYIYAISYYTNRKLMSIPFGRQRPIPDACDIQMFLFPSKPQDPYAFTQTGKYRHLNLLLACLKYFLVVMRFGGFGEKGKEEEWQCAKLWCVLLSQLVASRFWGLIHTASVWRKS